MEISISILEGRGFSFVFIALEICTYKRLGSIAKAVVSEVTGSRQWLLRWRSKVQWLFANAQLFPDSVLLHYEYLVIKDEVYQRMAIPKPKHSSTHNMANQKMSSPYMDTQSPLQHLQT